MRSLSEKTIAAMTVLGLFLGSTALQADDSSQPGIIRISDNQPLPEPDPLTNTDQAGPASCPPGDYVNENQQRYRTPVSAWLSEDGCTHSPDHGWARPAKYPIRRQPVQYQRYWPGRWYGEPGSGLAKNAKRFPVIYTPTDTTQLGYYYQIVPQWTPNPAMIPPAPWPSVWHHRECSSNCNTRYQPSPAPQPNRANEAPPVPQNLPEPNEPKALNNSASNDTLQTTGL